MNSKKFSNQDLINATFEIYEKFNTHNGIKKKSKIKNNNSKPLLLSKEVRPQKKECLGKLCILKFSKQNQKPIEGIWQLNRKNQRPILINL